MVKASPSEAQTGQGPDLWTSSEEETCWERGSRSGLLEPVLGGDLTMSLWCEALGSSRKNILKWQP